MPCYYPQYDTVWYPTPWTKNYDNQPSQADIEGDRLRYVSGYEHELGHRAINFRTIVGFIHLTFTLIKIHALFDRFPVMKDPDETDKWLFAVDDRSKTFFESTAAWDESYTVLHTMVMAEAFGLPDVAETYRLFACKTYPAISRYVDLIFFLRDRVTGPLEARALLIASLFDTAAAVDPFPILGKRWAAPENPALPLDQNVDARFFNMLEFCENCVKRTPKIAVPELAGKLREHLDRAGISVGVQYDTNAYRELFSNIAEDYLDGLILNSMYAVLTRQLLKDMEKLLLPVDACERAGGRPVSTVTIRPHNEQVIPVIRESLLFDVQEVHFAPGVTVKVNVGKCFSDLLVIGAAADGLIRERRFGVLSHVPEIFGTVGRAAKVTETLRAAFARQIDCEAVGEAFRSAITFGSGVDTSLPKRSAGSRLRELLRRFIGRARE